MPAKLLGVSATHLALQRSVDAAVAVLRRRTRPPHRRCRAVLRLTGGAVVAAVAAWSAEGPPDPLDVCSDRTAAEAAAAVASGEVATVAVNGAARASPTRSVCALMQGNVSSLTLATE
jgi:hypothetical protein